MAIVLWGLNYWVGFLIAIVVIAVFGAVLDMREVYGQTENCGLATGMPDRIKLGTVGVVAPRTELKISPEGEILLRGPHVFLGYYNQPEKTAETLRDGWLHTGDIGFVDNEG